MNVVIGSKNNIAIRATHGQILVSDSSNNWVDIHSLSFESLQNLYNRLNEGYRESPFEQLIHLVDAEIFYRKAWEADMSLNKEESGSVSILQFTK